MNNQPSKDAKDLQSLANMLAPQYSQSQIREFYLTGLLTDFIGTDIDYWTLIRRYEVQILSPRPFIPFVYNNFHRLQLRYIGTALASVAGL